MSERELRSTIKKAIHVDKSEFISVGASPFTYQNKDLKPIIVIVFGGSVSAIYLSADGLTFYQTGMTNGAFTLLPDMYMVVTYTVTPSMTKLY